APEGVDAQLIHDYVTPILILSLAGLALAIVTARGRGERLVVATLLGAALLQTIFTRAYGVSDPPSYFEPALAFGALALPLLVAPLVPRARAALIATALAAVTIVALSIAWLPVAKGFRTGVEITDMQVRALWSSIPAGPGIVFWRH